MDLNEVLYDGAIRHSVYVNRYAVGLANRIIKNLRDAERDLLEQLVARVGDLSKIDSQKFVAGQAATTQRLIRLRDALAALQAQYRELIERPLTSELEEFASYESEWSLAQLRQAPIALSLNAPTRAQLKAIVTRRPFEGRLLRDWAKEWGAARKARAAAQLRTGLILGETTTQIARRLKRTLQISHNSANAVVLTAANHVSTQAFAEVSRANSDVIAAWVHRSTLDSRTTAECMSLDGTIYRDVERVRWTPIHIRCRSRIVWVTKSAQALGATPNAGSRVSMSGAVPDNLSYRDWIERQPYSFQRDVLGKARADLLRAGKVKDVDRFFDHSNQRLWTLDELRTKEPGLFAN